MSDDWLIVWLIDILGLVDWGLACTIYEITFGLYLFIWTNNCTVEMNFQIKLERQLGDFLNFNPNKYSFDSTKLVEMDFWISVNLVA